MNKSKRGARVCVCECVYLSRACAEFVEWDVSYCAHVFLVWVWAGYFPHAISDFLNFPM